MRSFALLLVLPAVAYGALIFGGADTAKKCGKVLVNGTVKDNVPDPDNCSQYYVCTNWFQSKMKCKSGNHFSATEKKCTNPCAAACDTSLECSTTSEPQTSTQAATVAQSSTAETTPAGLPNVATDATTGVPAVTSVDVTKASEVAEIATEISEIVSEAAAKVTDVAAEVSDVAAEVSDVAAEVSDVAAEVSDAAAGASDAAAIVSDAAAKVSADTRTDAPTEASAETSDESEETTTPFWQSIMKHFNQPPSTLPGFTGSIPE